jgi:hypothetical protein
VIASTVLLAGASVELEAERDAPGANITSFGDAMWWALTTVTTVGYGDRYPVTPEGRVVGGVLMVVGIATVGAVTAAIASQLINPAPAAPIRTAPTAAGTTPAPGRQRPPCRPYAAASHLGRTSPTARSWCLGRVPATHPILDDLVRDPRG